MRRAAREQQRQRRASQIRATPHRSSPTPIAPERGAIAPRAARRNRLCQRGRRRLSGATQLRQFRGRAAIPITVTFAAARPDEPHALLIPARKGSLPDEYLGGDDEAALRRAASGSRFEGESGAIVELFGEKGRIMLAGAGAADADQGLEKAGGAAAAKLLKSGEELLAIDASGIDAPEAGPRVAFGALQRAWMHEVYRTTLKPKQKTSLKRIVIVNASSEDQAAWPRYEHLAAGIALARELVTEPPNVIHPIGFVERVRGPLEKLGVSIETLDGPAMLELGMGALMGVAQGSINDPRLLVMRWDGTRGKATKPLALVGKGVTFDTGGISIKPAAGMEDMKFDMGGAAAIAGAFRALAGRKAKCHVVGVCGLVENMPSATAQRPSDVVTTMSGKTVEVINTDAEGRLVLCDALTWVQEKHGPETIVDLATLTGAMIISLGYEHGGIFANDDALADQLLAAGKASGDPLWRQPLGEAYDKLIDSPIADMKNIGPREAGSITAAQFLKRFIDDGVKWAHLDIAGMVWAKTATSLWDKGATGYGVRLLERFVRDNFDG
ncbi:MAG: leucyl aminopeptidase [Sphingomonadaceae bacterium]|nr:leucyl aminopeptidase [Sphingomonadaceae bacterium]